MSDLVSNSLLAWINDSNLKIIFTSIIILLLITAVAIGVDYLIRKTLIHLLNNKLRSSKRVLAKFIEKYKVFNALGLIVFGLVFVFGSFLLVQPEHPLSLVITNIILKSANLFNLYVLTLTINRFFFALHNYYQHTSSRKDKSSWHSYIKIISFFTWIIAFILAIAYIFGQPPTSIITGVGALSALVLLIFRDTILGIVASIQANATSMIRVGDWIVIDKFGIDGTVEEISINSVRIRESDNTITTIPTYAITTEAVKNMEFMKLSGARRFSEKLFIEPLSIRFVNEDFIKKVTDLISLPNLDKIDKKNLTNLSLYRHFLVKVLQDNLQLNKNYSTSVRIGNMLPTTGVPLSITGYTNDTTTIIHEEIKASILEVAYASINLFELKIAVNACSGS